MLWPLLQAHNKWSVITEHEESNSKVNDVSSDNSRRILERSEAFNQCDQIVLLLKGFDNKISDKSRCFNAMV